MGHKRQPWVPPSSSPTRRSPTPKAVKKRPTGKKTRVRRKADSEMTFLNGTLSSAARVKGKKQQAVTRMDREAVEQSKLEADEMGNEMRHLMNEFHKLNAAAKVSGVISP